MNGIARIVEMESLPKAINENEYEKYMNGIDSDADKRLFANAYKRDNTGNTYKLHLPPLDEDDKRLVEIFKKIWRRYATISIVAEYIYEHRLNCERYGDAIDDFRKAEFLVNIVNYLNQKRSSMILLRRDDEMEVIIDMVNNIFDSAYFRKINHSEKLDIDCFLEAEREFCEEKDIDHLEHQIHDHDAAERLHVHQEINALAFQQYLWRKTEGKLGDAMDDWSAAEQEYPKWRMRKRIAEICYNLSKDKHQHRNHYWSLACAVIADLDAEPYDHGKANPAHDTHIHDVILKKISPTVPRVAQETTLRA